MNRLRALPLLLALAATCPSAAELALDTPVVDVRPRPEDETVEVTFAFTNKGSIPVRVLGLESACSCLSADLDKAVYQPGEKGSGRAVFKVSTFVGVHEKTLHVQTDDPNQEEWVVPFRLTVPEILRIEPKTLQWWVGDDAQTQITRVTVTGDDPIRITGITSTRENVEFSWREIQPGREYEVSVKPKSTNEVMLGALRIETDSSIPKYRRQMAFFSVYRKPEGQP
jgi:hypothetical protein